MNRKTLIISLALLATSILSGSVVLFVRSNSQNAANASSSQTLAATSTIEFRLTSVPTVTANAQWNPQVQSFDGVPMALVPPGCFMMGTPDTDIAALDQKNKTTSFDNQGPQTKICFDHPFWIDQFAVWQAQFKQFGGKAITPSHFAGDQRPVEDITWFEAKAYCEQQRGGRLLTEAEFEYAARGPDDWVYPWGNDFVDANLVYSDNSDDQTANVGSKPGGKSWVGALDMDGNVWQWTSSIFLPYPYDVTDGREDNSAIDVARALRGGSWLNTSTIGIRAAVRGWDRPNYENDSLGVRCARDY